MSPRFTQALLVAACLFGLGRPGSTEPHFLAKQYTRCLSCHYSPTGGGMLTPYGRSLSRQEIASWGRSVEGEDSSREERFLFGALGDRLGENLALGINLRPSRVKLDFGFFERTRRLWMQADLQGAYTRGGWTAYGEIGRRPPESDDAAAGILSRQHWIGYLSGNGFGIRAGRFQPAFGVYMVDHTSFNRREVGLDQDSQIYGLELNQVNDTTLVQFSLGPGRAESLLDDDGSASWTASGRLQWEPRNRHVLVLSGMYRGANDFEPASWFGGVAYGWSPRDRVALWTELVERASRGWDGTPEYTVVHEAAFEVARGLWLKFSPQLRTQLGDVSKGSTRIGIGWQFFPRAHWDINGSWYRVRDRETGAVLKTLMLQFHAYL